MRFLPIRIQSACLLAGCATFVCLLAAGNLGASEGPAASDDPRHAEEQPLGTSEGGILSSDGADLAAAQIECPGDFDGDGVVGPADLAELLGTEGASTREDVYPDLRIDATDYVIVLSDYGPCPFAPEPSDQGPESGDPGHEGIGRELGEEESPEAAEPFCRRSDVNLDGVVDATDLAMVIGMFGQTVEPLHTDLDGNRMIDDGDHRMLFRYWGPCEDVE